MWFTKNGPVGIRKHWDEVVDYNLFIFALASNLQPIYSFLFELHLIAEYFLYPFRDCSNGRNASQKVTIS
jgi:hypothetical protein